MSDRTDFAPTISPRPAWADRTELHPDSIVHAWTAPTVAEGIEPGGDFVLIHVEVLQIDSLDVTDDGVVLDPGPGRIFLLDTGIADTANARRLAAALLECCDRIDAAGGDR